MKMKTKYVIVVMVLAVVLTALAAGGCSSKSTNDDSSNQATTTPSSQDIAATDCLKCHGPFSKVQAASAGYVAADGTAVNPHRTIDPANGATMHSPSATAQPMECLGCHSTHAQPPASAAAVPRPKTLDACFKCHHMMSFSPCIGCHASATGGD
ncbi:MAG: hypothetical protein HGA39_02140 [Coriobacteriia bacterium]|nr:hypothetical protein [Coriobacteriia bacterium]